MRSSRQANASVTTGIVRLKTYFFNTTGITSLSLSFRHFIDARSSGATMKIQSSPDGTNWTDEGWSKTPNTTNIGPSVESCTIVNNLNSPTTMIAFVVTGSLRNYDFWYIDDVSIKAPGYWVGGTPSALTDWNTPSNWGDGLVPTATKNVYIPPRTYLPVLSNNPAAVCKDLIIAPNATITVNTGRTITVSGNMVLKAAP
jgi:hypothetical protein